MTHLRRALARIALTWLLCQAATLTLGPAALWFDSAERLLKCTCTHGDHAICPMHHKPAPGSKICLMRSAGEDGVAMPGWLMNVGVVPAPAHAVVVPDREGNPFLVDFTTASLRPAPPDPPPPRA